jgi:hypothetical protein
LNGATVPDAVTGKYLVLDRVWAKRDRLELNFILPLRFVAGANESAGKVSLYRGPVLLTFDQAENGFDEDALPAVALERLMDARVIAPSEAAANFESCFCPWLMVEVPSVKGPPLRLVDFASAGARGTRYQSWLPASPEPCAPAITETPADAARVPPGPMLFRWRGPRSPEISCRVEFSCDETFSAGAGWFTNVTGEQAVVDSRSLSALTGTAGSPIFWRVATSDTNGETIADVPPAWFRILPGLPKGD